MNASSELQSTQLNIIPPEKHLPKFPIPDAPPDPPYAFVVVNRDRFKTGEIEIHRIFVFSEWPDKEKKAEMQEMVDEDRSIIDEVDIIEAYPQIYHDFRDEILEIYVRSMN